jgi:SNF2 family DNA or RNA helicase
MPEGYHFRLEPYPHQMESLLRGLDKDAYAYLLEPGLGKSSVCIHDAQVAFLRGNIKAALIVVPNSITTNWIEEIEKHGNLPSESMIYDPSKKLTVTRWIESPTLGLRYLIMAVETFSMGEGKHFAEKFLRAQPTAIYLDESSRIKTHSSSRTKALLALAPLSPRRRIATGTAITKGIQDFWAQAQFLSPKILNLNYFAFRLKHCIMGGYKQKEIVGNRDVDGFLDAIAPYSVVYRKEECLKLPERVFQVRRVTPSDQQKALYAKLKAEGAAEVGDGVVSFTIPLVRDLRLQQITGGFVAVEDDRVIQDMSTAMNLSMEVVEQLVDRIRTVPVPGPNPKLDELFNIFEEIPYKTIVWFRFRSELKMVAEEIKKIYGPKSFVEFHGDIDNEGRAEARRRLQEDPECRFFLGQISTGSMGITLTAARVSVYFSNSWSLEERIQSQDRTYRIGTVASPIYIDLTMDQPSWVDAKIHRALIEGRDYVAEITDQLVDITR